MRISDWSSDVCSSDLSSASSAAGASSAATSEGGVASSNSSSLSGSSAVATASACSSSNIAAMTSMPWLCISARSEERRVGKECVDLGGRRIIKKQTQRHRKRNSTCYCKRVTYEYHVSGLR